MATETTFQTVSKEFLEALENEDLDKSYILDKFRALLLFRTTYDIAPVLAEGALVLCDLSLFELLTELLQVLETYELEHPDVPRLNFFSDSVEGGGAGKDGGGAGGADDAPDGRLTLLGTRTLDLAVADPAAPLHVIRKLMDRKAKPSPRVVRTAFDTILNTDDPQPNTDVLKLLLESKVDPNSKIDPTLSRTTVFDYALSNVVDLGSRHDVIELLLRHNADPNRHNALSTAVTKINEYFEMNIELVKSLLDAKANANAPTILERAVQNDSALLLQTLVGARAHLDGRCRDLLKRAAEANAPSSARWIVDAIRCTKELYTGDYDVAASIVAENYVVPRALGSAYFPRATPANATARMRYLAHALRETVGARQNLDEVVPAVLFGVTQFERRPHVFVESGVEKDARDEVWAALALDNDNASQATYAATFEHIVEVVGIDVTQRTLQDEINRLVQTPFREAKCFLALWAVAPFDNVVFPIEDPPEVGANADEDAVDARNYLIRELNKIRLALVRRYEAGAVAFQGS